jgi:hypothetical protein
MKLEYDLGGGLALMFMSVLAFLIVALLGGIHFSCPTCEDKLTLNEIITLQPPNVSNQVLRTRSYVCIHPLELYNITEGRIDLSLQTGTYPTPIYSHCGDGPDVLMYDNQTLEVTPCCFENTPPDYPPTIEEIKE